MINYSDSAIGRVSAVHDTDGIRFVTDLYLANVYHNFQNVHNIITP